MTGNAEAFSPSPVPAPKSDLIMVLGGCGPGYYPNAYGQCVLRGGYYGGGGYFRLKHDITLLGYIPNGVGFYRFVYNGGSKAYVGVIAQEVRGVMPEAVFRGRDGYLRVDYDKIGVKFQTYDQWSTSGARIPTPWTPSMQ
jgi:hypothetical protein